MATGAAEMRVERSVIAITSEACNRSMLGPVNGRSVGRSRKSFVARRLQRNWEVEGGGRDRGIMLE